MPTHVFAALLVFVAGLVVNIVVLFYIYRKVPPNKLMVVSGFGGVKVLIGGGKIVFPGLQQAYYLDLFPVVLRVNNRDYRNLPPTITVCINVENPEAAYKAATRLTGKNEKEIASLLQTLADESLDELRRNGGSDDDVFWSTFRARIHEVGMVIVGEAGNR